LSTPGSVPQVLVTDLGERGLIARIRARLPASSPDVVVGIGDDAAVVRRDRNALQVLTTDALLDGVHFDRRFCSLADAGYKAMAVNVSDIAAMGGEPRLALLSLQLPAGLSVEDVDTLVDGVAAMAAEARVTVVGGNVTRTPGPLAIDVTLVGSVRPRRCLTRGGARAGDDLYVSGALGAGAAGLAWLRRHGHTPLSRPDDDAVAECVDRYRRPSPRARLGRLLGRSRSVRACMDLSDGLADAVRQVAEACGTGARIEAGAIPVHPGARAFLSDIGADPVAAALSGGDDYELLFALPPKRTRHLHALAGQARGLTLTRIGRLTREAELVLVHDDRVQSLPDGFAHF
jgi:thiamine-monophosphate kinase